MNFWVIKLRLSTLLWILKKVRHSDSAALTYVEITRPCYLLLTLLIKFKLVSFTLDRIIQRHGPAGPLLNLSSLRNDKGEVITIHIYHHILKLRRLICQQLVDAFKHFDFFKDNKPLNMLTAYLGMEVARDITPAVYMAHYARWQKYGGNSKKQVSNILVIPAINWASTLVENFNEELGLSVICQKNNGFRKLVKISLILLKTIISVSRIKIKNRFKWQRISSQKSAFPNGIPGRIMVNYRLGLLEDERNDINFYHYSSLDPGRMLVFVKYGHHLPSDDEMAWMSKNGVHAVLDKKIKTKIPGLPRWESSPNLKKELENFYLIYLKTAIKACREKKGNTLWLLDRLWKMGIKRAFWKDFFVSNHVRILVNSAPSEENFLINMALSETGGLAVNVERSLLFDYCTYFHNSPNHISFIAGSYSLTQIPEPSFSLVTIQVGGVNVAKQHPEIEGINRLKKCCSLLISVFDELPNDWFFGDSVAQMYSALLKLVEEERGIGLLIKSKKPEILKLLDEVNQKVTELSREGKCLVASWKITASTAAANSDLVVCVPSTAAFESVMTGARTIVYNPMRSGSRLFYSNNGLKQRIFEDSETMVSAIKNFFTGKDKRVGDCSDLLYEIDPFNDGRASQRVGNYLKCCLESYDREISRDGIIKISNQKYESDWGKDKITEENYYEPYN